MGESVLMKVGIIGYNLFAVGGTVQSNLNLLNIFSEQGCEITYYNYVPFYLHDIKKVCTKYPQLSSVHFKLIKEFFNKQPENKLDVIFITREDLFPLAKLLRFYYPKALIIGEIHTPLQLLGNLNGLKYLSCVRVATHSIKENFEKKYDYTRIYVQPVSTRHIKWNFPKTTKLTTNFVIHSRFFEKQKDIMYSLQLFEYLKKQKQTGYHLYINGTGKDELLYQKFINDHQLTKMVSINQTLPNNYIYLSTSNFESFGYSIVEAIASGHFVVAYWGEDKVLYENFKNIPQIIWLKKQSVAADVAKLQESSKKKLSLAEYQKSKEIIKNLTGNYYERFKRATLPYKSIKFESVKLTKTVMQDIQSEIEGNLGKLNPSMIKRIYYWMLHHPIFNKLFQNKLFQKFKSKVK